MGAFTGLICFGMVIWFHETAARYKLPSVKWAGIGAVTFIVGTIVGYLLIYALQLGAGEDTSVSAPAARAPKSDYVGLGATQIVGIIYEFIPIVSGTVLALFVRARFIMKARLRDSLKKQ